MRWNDYYEDPDAEGEKLEKRIKENPADAEAYYELGALCDYAHDWGRAKNLADKAVELEPGNVTYQAFRVFMTAWFTEYKEAIDGLVTVIELGGEIGDYPVDMAWGALRGFETEYVISTVRRLRKEGKNHIAAMLESMLIEH